MSSVEVLEEGVVGPAGYGTLLDLDPSVLEAMPAAVYICSADGVVIRFNRRAAELWGRTPRPGDTDERFCGSFRLYRMDGTLLPHDRTPMEAALRTGRPQRGKEVVIERPDGSRVVALVNIEPLKDARGKIEGAINCFEDITARKQADAELRTSRAALQETEQRFRMLLDALPSAIYTTDSDGRLTYYNDAAAELWGQRPELGESTWCGSWKLYWPDGTPLPHDQCPMAMALKEKRPVRGMEAIAERPDGTRVPFIPFPTPTFDSSGALTGAVNMLVDISGRKQAETALRRLDDRFGTLNQIARTLSSDLDLERIVQAVTDSATALSGAQFGAFFYNVTDDAGERSTLYTLSGAPRSAFEEFGLPRNTTVFEPTFRGGAVVRSDDIRKDPRYGRDETRSGMPAGHLPVVSYLAIPVVSRSGEIHGGLFFGHEKPGVFTQETEELVSGIAAHAALAIDNALLLKAAQTEVDERRRAERDAFRLASIVESSDDAIASKDLDGIITSWNAGAERIFGYTAEEIVGKSVTILIPEDHHDEEPSILARVRAGKRVEHYETIRRRKDGTLIDVSLTVSPIRNRDGKVIGASKIARDITDRKRAEVSLARHMDELAALYALTDSLHRAAALPEVYDAALNAILRALPCKRASILLFDEAGVMRFVAWRGLSDSYRQAVEGHSPWTPDELDARPICIADIDDADLPDSLRDTLREERIRACAFIPLVTGGKLVGKFMTYYDQPHAFDGREVELALSIARQLGFGVERIRAQEELRRKEEHERARAAELQAIMEAVPAVVWIARDPEAQVILGNRAAHETLRIPQEENLSLSAPEAERPDHFEVVVDGRVLSPEELPVQRAARGEEVRNYEEEVRFNDGTRCSLLGNATPLLDARGKPSGAVAAFVDITDRKRAEEQRDLLIAELNHRVKNTLATVISIARQSFSKSTEMEEARSSFDARIRALAQTHSRLSETNWSGVSVETMLLDEFAPYRHEDGGNIRLEGPPVALSPKCALTLGMAVHELATNAAKYGALSSKDGLVEVSWQADWQERKVSIRWTESGGPPVTPPRASGFGRLLLERALASDLNGDVRLDFAEDGLRCAIDLPLDECLATLN